MSSGIDREIRFEIKEQLAVISEHPTGWKKELNIVSWNGGEPKYDIRDWSEEHTYMTRGITLHQDEAYKLLIALLNKFDCNE